MKTGYRGKGKFAAPENPFSPEEPIVRGKGHEKMTVSVDEDSDRPDWAMGNNELNPHSKGGGQPDGAGDMKGDLYGDLYVILRDLDSNGAPVLDDYGHEILISSEVDENGEPIYIYKTEDGDIPEDQLDNVQEVEFSRLSVARSPAAVMEHALDEALTKLADATSVSLDMAGRLVVDGSTIDSPLENLALYQFLLTTDQEEWPESVPEDVDVAALLGAAADKTTPVTLDTLIYENTILDVNEVNPGTGEVTYEDFTTFDYSRLDKYGDALVSWYEDTDGDPTTLELQTDTVLNAVFDGQNWVDENPAAGVDDFTQAADDARAVIDFLHSEIVIDPVEADALLM